MKNIMEKYLKLYQQGYSSAKTTGNTCYPSREEYLQEQEITYREHIKDEAFERQVVLFPLLIRNPYFLGLYEAFSAWDMQLLNNVLYQASRHETIQRGGSASGYDHCINFFKVIEAMAANDTQLVFSLLPKELGLSQNGHTLLLTGTNLIMALLYPDEQILEKSREKATKYLLSKRTALERALIECLLSLADHDIEKTSLTLKDICVASRKSQGQTPLSKCFCRNAHGLYHLAHLVLSEIEFQKLEPPQDEGFINQLAHWNSKNDFPKGDLFLTMPGDLALMNSILTVEIPRQHLHRAYENSSTLYTDTVRFNNELVEMVRAKRRPQ